MIENKDFVGERITLYRGAHGGLLEDLIAVMAAPFRRETVTPDCRAIFASAVSEYEAD